MADGWIKLHRCLLDKPIWSCSSIEQRVILITILMLANHAEKQWEWKGKKFICKAGQFITSSTNLAAAAGVTRQNVRTALNRFKDYEFLTYESTKTGLLVTLVNWDKYQSNDAEPNQPFNQWLTNDQPTANQQLTTNKNDKNDKNDKKIISICASEKPRSPFENLRQQKLFDSFWQAYPKKKSKGQAERTWIKLNPGEQLVATMIATIGRAKTSREWLKDGGQYIPHPSTWLNAAGWEDEYGQSNGIDDDFECKVPLFRD